MFEFENEIKPKLYCGDNETLPQGYDGYDKRHNCLKKGFGVARAITNQDIDNFLPKILEMIDKDKLNKYLNSNEGKDLKKFIEMHTPKESTSQEVNKIKLMTDNELKTLANRLGIKNTLNMTKVQIINEISNRLEGMKSTYLNIDESKYISPGLSESIHSGASQGSNWNTDKILRRDLRESPLFHQSKDLEREHSLKSSNVSNKDKTNTILSKSTRKSSSNLEDGNIFNVSMDSDVLNNKISNSEDGSYFSENTDVKLKPSNSLESKVSSFDLDSGETGGEPKVPGTRSLSNQSTFTNFLNSDTPPLDSIDASRIDEQIEDLKDVITDRDRTLSEVDSDSPSSPQQRQSPKHGFRESDEFGDETSKPPSLRDNSPMDSDINQGASPFVGEARKQASLGSHSKLYYEFLYNRRNFPK